MPACGGKTDGQTDRQTDGRMDGFAAAYTELCSAERCKKLCICKNFILSSTSRRL